jgi:hypothetical protein
MRYTDIGLAEEKRLLVLHESELDVRQIRSCVPENPPALDFRARRQRLGFRKPRLERVRAAASGALRPEGPPVFAVELAVDVATDARFCCIRPAATAVRDPACAPRWKRPGWRCRNCAASSCGRKLNVRCADRWLARASRLPEARCNQLVIQHRRGQVLPDDHRIAQPGEAESQLLQ